MIIIKLYVNGFDIVGHSDYNNYGENIVCAAVSAISQGFINSYRETDIKKLIIDENIPKICFSLKEKMSPEASRIISSQLKTIYNSYKEEIDFTKYEHSL